VRSGSGGSAYVNADRVRLTQVFANLLGNAAKYMDMGGRLSINVIPDEHRVSVVIQDTGIGIPQNMLARIFDMFTQVPASLDRAQGGLGIGLTLVRRLVELHGGRVSAYSRGVGEGSTFTVSLPVVAAPPFSKQPQAAPTPAPALVPAAATAEPMVKDRKPRVLVVDDNKDGAETLAEILGFMGAEVRVAHDGREAVPAARAFAPDLILLDIGLPGIDGYEAARQLRAEPGLHARLIALTGYGTAQDRQRALDAGFDDHLIKPLSPEATQQVLDQLTAMHSDS
jgi:CheY-like chemotaxis protein